jgi:hypothetical protein
MIECDRSTSPCREKSPGCAALTRATKLEATHVANLAEYVKAKATMNVFSKLIGQLCDRIDAKHVSISQAPTSEP